MTFEQKLKSKIEREAIEIHDNLHARIGPFFAAEHYEEACVNGANLLVPLLIYVYNSLECNTTFHRLGGLDDCEPCKLKLKLEQFAEE